MQKAFHEMHGLQCGFCTPGMIMASIDLVNDNPNPTEDEVREGIEGNLCRCTGYQNIVRAVQQAAARDEPVGSAVMTIIEDAATARAGRRRSARRAAARRTPG